MIQIAVELRTNKQSKFIHGNLKLTVGLFGIYLRTCFISRFRIVFKQKPFNFTAIFADVLQNLEL